MIIIVILLKCQAEHVCFSMAFCRPLTKGAGVDVESINSNSISVWHNVAKHGFSRSAGQLLRKSAACCPACWYISGDEDLDLVMPSFNEVIAEVR